MTAQEPQKDENYQGEGSGKPPVKARPIVAAMEKGPGPAVYKLPQNVVYESHGSTKKREPAWTFKGRYGKFTEDSSPGPKYGITGSVTHKGVQRSKSFTMSARNRPLQNLMSDNPGPGHFSPHVNFLSNHKKNPEWVIGERNAFRLGDNNPAPNMYGLPGLLGTGIPNKSNSASYSLHVRARVGAPDEDLSKTPGPAAYSAGNPNVLYPQKPRWTMSARNKNMSKLMDTPAPNVYLNSASFMDKKAAPKFSMGIKHSEYCMPLIIDAWD